MIYDPGTSAGPPHPANRSAPDRMLAEYGVGIVPVYAVLGALCCAGLTAGAQQVAGGPATVWWAAFGALLTGLTVWRKIATVFVRRRYAGRYVDHSMVDEPSQILLLQAQWAVDAVLAADTMGLVHEGDKVLLRQAEWTIARSLAGLSRLRSNAEPGVAHSVLLAASAGAVTGDVQALLLCAQQAEAAAGAWRDHCSEHLDLAAIAGAAEHEVDDLGQLAQRLRLSSLG